MRVLQERGFNVYGALTMGSRSERTSIIDLRDTSRVAARTVAASMRVPRRFAGIVIGWHTPPIVGILDSSRYVEVRVLLGADYRCFFPGVVPLK